MNRFKRHANSPPEGNKGKKIDNTSTPEHSDVTNSVPDSDGATGFSSASLPLASHSRHGTSITSATTSVSAASKTSARFFKPKKALDPNLMKGIPGQFYGRHRDVIEVEVLDINGSPYTTNMRSSDAIRDIYMKALGLDKNQIIGVQVAWKGRPLISFRLKEKIPIDELPASFSYEKETKLDDGSVINQVINCKIKGVRPPKLHVGYVDDGTRWVTFEKCGWKLTHEQVLTWAAYYGEVLSKVKEDTHDDLDPDVQPENNTVGCGDLKVLVRVKRPIPQFLPMFGYKVRVYYKEIPRVCTNCYTTGHVKKDCQKPNKQWLHFVVDFITDNENIPEDHFGIWMKKSREFIQADKQMFECPPDVANEADFEDLNLDDSESNESSDETVVEPVKTVTNIVKSIETKNKKDTNEKKTKNKSRDKTPPTREAKKRGRPPK